MDGQRLRKSVPGSRRFQDGASDPRSLGRSSEGKAGNLAIIGQERGFLP